MRIGREFGNHVLPLRDGYVDARSAPIQGKGAWSWLLLQWRLDLLPRCVEREGKPGWELVPDGVGYALVLPSTSRMARQWGYHNGLLGGFNHTSLGLVEIS